MLKYINLVKKGLWLFPKSQVILEGWKQGVKKTTAYKTDHIKMRLSTLLLYIDLMKINNIINNFHVDNTKTIKATTSNYSSLAN